MISKKRFCTLFGLLALPLLLVSFLQWRPSQLRYSSQYTPDTVSYSVRNNIDSKTSLGFESKSNIIVKKESTVHATQPLCSVNSRVDGDIMKYGRLNQTYMEEKMSVPVAGQCVCRDVVCSNFLTDKDWKQWNSCIGKGESKPHNVIPKCRFQDGSSRPYVALKSFPGSGNTWVRQLLEESTGICTGIHLVTVRLLCVIYSIVVCRL